jgi:hypothetical protein
VLAVQDTTSLNYSSVAKMLGLGPIGSKANAAQGLHLHSTLALTTQGLPLGFVDAQCWARDPEEFGQAKSGLPIEQKESYRWIKSYREVAKIQERHPQLTLVSVGDREADIYELFAEAAQHPQGPKLLIRARHDREVEDEAARLFATVRSQLVAGYMEVHLPRQKERPARVAKLAIRFARVRLCPPQDKPHLPTLELNAVQALEVGAPKTAEPVDWRMLSTLPVEDFEQAGEKVQWYAQRWMIEVFHRTLKSGCRIEDRHFGDADRLEACLAIDMVVAWRICHLVKLGREVPHVEASVYFEDAEWKALVAYSTNNPDPPAKPPTLGEVIRMVAKLGGFRGRKSDGEPGTEVMWRGLQGLDFITHMWLVMQQAVPSAQRLNDTARRLRPAMKSGP